MTGSLAQSDFRLLRELANRWQDDPPAQAAADLHGVLNEIGARRCTGPDFLDADVYGGTVPELRAAALAEGRALYGEDACLAVERVSKVLTTLNSRRGRFTATVLVRCINFTELPL